MAASKKQRASIAGWLGIPGFDRYAVLRIDATKPLISAIGGVDVDVKNSNCLRYKTDCTGETLDYDDTWGHLHIHLKEGMQHLNGDQAVAYMRFRHDWCSDPCRIMRQQQVLHAMVARLKNDRFNTLMHIGDLIGVFHKYVQTDFSDSELLSLATYFQGMAPSGIVSKQVPYTDDINLPNYGDSLVPDTQARAQLVQSMLVAPPAPRRIAGCDGAWRRSRLRRCALTSKTAAACLVRRARLAAKLQKAGFTIGQVGNADRSDYNSTEVHEHSTVTFAGAKVRCGAAKGAP